MLKEITLEEFKKSLLNSKGDFRGRVFNFSFDLQELLLETKEEVNFDIDFSKSIFKKDVSLAKIDFKKSFNFSKVEANGIVDFFNARFRGNFHARNSVFSQKTNFNLARFHSDTDFNRSIFLDSVHFKKVRFYRNLFLGKVFFLKKVDFSYAHFSNDYYTSFMSINRFPVINHEKVVAPYLIFRNIYFPQRTIFNNIDLSRTIFQDSVINGTIFKDCAYPKKDGRNAFYPEIAKEVEISIDQSLDNLKKGLINTILLPLNKNIEDLNISDILNIKSKSDKESSKFFIVTRFDGDNPKNLKKILQKSNLKKVYAGFDEIICQDCTKLDTKEVKVVAFRLKSFDEKKHWEVLEDNYRQMKKSLEEIRDWQGAGDFYRGEMYAKIKLLESTKKEFWYRKTLCFYRMVSAFGESIKRIVFVMGITFILATIFLIILKPELGIFAVMEKNIGFFLPIFGNNSATISSLELKPWQNVIIQIEIIWFYILWLIMAIAIRRRFRR